MSEKTEMSTPPPVAERQGSEYVTTQSFDRLSAAFESSARRWELVVYPSLFAFILLAAYGFYLIYSLAKDVHYLAISVDTHMTVLASNMQSVSADMNRLTVSVGSINQRVGTLEPMLANISSMERSMQAMTMNTGRMGQDMNTMNRNISRPMSFMNSFMPW